MRTMNKALLGGVALAVATGAARADELIELKAALSALDARVAAMEATPALPDGFRLLSVSDGMLEETPGSALPARARAAYGGRATIIRVLPAADAPAGASISWSGYSRAGFVYKGESGSTHDKAYTLQDEAWVRAPELDVKTSKTGDDTDVGARGQLLVQAKTETRVGEIGAEMELRADFNGNGNADFYGKIAWGYWQMTPDLVMGGGYNESIADLAYGYDGSCTCYFTDNADVDFNPGDTTQLRLGYTAGPVTFTAALESAALDNENDAEDNAALNDGLIGVAGEISYSGDVFSGEIAGLWRDSNEAETGASQLWQIGLGGSIALGEVGTVTFAAATGEGPYQVQSSGTIINELPYDNRWWGASLWSSFNLGDKAHIELAGGYKHRDGSDVTYNDGKTTYDVSDVDYHTYAVMGGLYYTPVDQLTVGLEGEWYTTSTDGDAIDTKTNVRYDVDAENDTLWADFVAVWSF